MSDEELTREAKRLIDSLAAKPRFAGSAEESAAREICASALRGAGLKTTEKEFEFSEWPGRWGIPLIAGGFLFAILLTAAAASTSLDLGGLAIMSTAVSGQLLFARRRDSATATMKWSRAKAVNLEAARDNPRVWLCAHLDSKSQSVPMLLRVLSHVALISLLFIEVLMVFAAQWEIVQWHHWNWFAIAGIVAAVPSLFCLVGNRSRGALDNATGVAAVLLAARLIRPGASFGVVITSGEELDLAGSRAWGRGPAEVAGVINCDTIDDEGAWRCMFGNRPHALGMAAENAAKKLGLPLRMGKMIPGIITDSLAFETAGLKSVTVSRGTLRTLALLHTRGDIPDRLAGTGVATAARLLAQMVEELS